MANNKSRVVKKPRVDKKPTPKKRPAVNIKPKAAKKSPAVNNKKTKVNKNFKVSKKPVVKIKEAIVVQKPIRKSFNRKWIGRFVNTVIVATYTLALIYAFRTNLAPNKYMALIVIISGLIELSVVTANIRSQWKSIVKSIALILLSLLIITANSYAYFVSASTYNFFNSIQSESYTIESYSIIAKNNSAVGLKSSNKLIGYIQDDANNDAVLQVVKSKTSATPKSYGELASLCDAIDAKNADTAVLRTSYLIILKENYPSFYQNIKVLDTFSIRVKARAAIKVDITKPFVVYISGIDTYGDIDTVSRSDVNILAVVDPRTNKILLVNTPRDYYVQLHGTTGTRDKLTHAGIYGIDMSKDTMQDLYGIDISYYVRINFTSLLNIIDAIGGVNVYSDNDFTAWKYHFVQGYNQLNADQALVFSRERHSFTDGDRTRGKNQERVIQAIIDKMSQPATLARFPQIIKSLEGSFQTNASHNVITALLKQQMNTLGAWTTESISVDGVGSQDATYSMGSQLLYVMEPNIASVNLAKDKIQSYLK